jgi:hypothetical protein
MNVRSRWGTFAAVGAAFVVGLTAPAGAHAVRGLAPQIDGSSIKKDSMPGNRIVSNSVTGTQIAESTLGHVPYANKAGTAAKLSPLVWHKLTLAGGWSVISNDGAPAYAVDAQGIVHLRGAICCGTGTQAFSLPAGARPSKIAYLLVFSQGAYAAELAVLPTGKAYLYPGAGAPSTSTTSLTSLDGVTFAGP